MSSKKWCFQIGIAVLTCCSTLSFATQADQQDALVKTLGSLLYHVNEEADLMQATNDAEDQWIIFTEKESLALWDKIFQAFQTSSSLQQKELLSQAYEAYYQFQEYKNIGLTHEALPFLQKSSSYLYHLWEQASTDSTSFSGPELASNLMRKASHPSALDHSKKISKKIKKQLHPHVIPDSHPLKPALDQIFYTTRATLDENTFAEAGFNTISVRPRSHIRVASHSLLPNHLIKATLDTELRKKANKESWEWLVLRCEGADKIKRLIKDRSIQHFVVARKWIYPLPDDPSPPNTNLYKRHLAVLLVTDMDLHSEKTNYGAWKNKITEEHLQELYTIISHAKGSSYRPDNIWYNKQGKFAFIDTEYPDRGPDYRSIKPFLNKEMQKYWTHLIKNGGD